jgi:hypothetical protein
MPRKDPITGCDVMTMPEFLQAEADREGTTPVAIMDEIHQSFEDDNALSRKRLTDDALAILQKDADEIRTHWEEGDEPIIRATEILVMLDVNYHQSFRGSNGGVGRHRLDLGQDLVDRGRHLDGDALVADHPSADAAAGVPVAPDGGADGVGHGVLVAIACNATTRS